MNDLLYKQNLHSHTFYDDGKCTPEEMVRGALEAGLDSIGICCHSPIVRQTCNWCIKPKDFNDFQREVYSAREKYQGVIDVHCGVELDILTGRNLRLDGFDYVIGAVHYLPLPDGSVPHLEDETIDRFPSEDGGVAIMYREVDLSRDALISYIQNGYDGDSSTAAEMYYRQYSKVAKDPTMDIVAHFDLITKFDEPGEMPKKDLIFKQSDRQYLEAGFAAMKDLVKNNKIFEINTGAVSRGYRSTFYPGKRFMKELKNLGGMITLSTDAHVPQHAGYMIDEAADYAKACGFKEVWVLRNGQFEPEKL